MKRDIDKLVRLCIQDSLGLVDFPSSEDKLFDLGCDSLDLILVIMTIEEEFDFKIEFPAQIHDNLSRRLVSRRWIKSPTTVGDLIEITKFGFGEYTINRSSRGKE